MRKDTFWLRMVNVPSTARTTSTARITSTAPSRGEPHVPASLPVNPLSPRIVLPGLTSVKVLTLVPLIVVPAAPTGMPVAPRVTAEAGRREEASHADHQPEEQDELDEC